MVFAHACGALTDLVIDRASAARTHWRPAVLSRRGTGDRGALEGWIDGAVAIDVMRALRLARQDYRIRTQTIPSAGTPKNRLLLGAPGGW